MPEIDILRYGLDKKTAEVIESAAIDLLGLDIITNKNKGRDSQRMSVKKIESLLGDKNFLTRMILMKIYW